MTRRLNGKEFPPCMIGTWGWGKGINGSGMVFGKNYGEEQLAETFSTAYNKGFTLWDTAENYGMGNAEKLLGQCIGGNKEVIISTKHMPAKKHKKGEISHAVNGSLQRLGVDTIDLYWLHKPYALQENIYEMIQCMKDGRIRGIGLSNCSMEQLKEAKNILEENGCALVAVQNHFSLLAMEAQKEIVKFCNENDILFFGYMVLEQGALSGHYDEIHSFPFLSMRGLSFGKRKFRRIRELLAYERDLAEKYQVDVSQIPIAWAVANKVIPIVGLTKPEHGKALAKGIKVKLTTEEIEELELLAQRTGVTCKGSWE